jgi:hypothetical protein
MATYLLIGALVALITMPTLNPKSQIGEAARNTIFFGSYLILLVACVILISESMGSLAS